MNKTWIVFEIYWDVYNVVFSVVCLTLILLNFVWEKLFVNMADCKKKVEYWKKRKVYHISKDDSVSFS